MFESTSELREQRQDAIATIGRAIQQDFQALVTDHTEGWLNQPNWPEEDSRECAALEVLLLDLLHIQEDLQTLEQWLTSGFIPRDQASLGAVFGKSSPSAIAESNRVSPPLLVTDESSPYPSGKCSTPVAKQSSILSVSTPTDGNPSPSPSYASSPASPLSAAPSSLVEHSKAPQENTVWPKSETSQNRSISHSSPVQGLKDLAQRLEQESPQGIELADEVKPLSFSSPERERDRSVQPPSPNRQSALRPSNSSPHQSRVQSSAQSSHSAALPTRSSVSSGLSVATAADLMAVEPVNWPPQSSSPGEKANSSTGEIDSRAVAWPQWLQEDAGQLSPTEGMNVRTTHFSGAIAEDHLQSEARESIVFHYPSARQQANFRVSGASIYPETSRFDSNGEFEETMLPRSQIEFQPSSPESLESRTIDHSSDPAMAQAVPASRLADLDLDQVMNAIALEIQREYRQFYGS